MADPFLIITIVVAILILMIVGVYWIVHFQHPDDKNEAWFPKFVVLFGFVLAGCTVFSLPLDVANNDGYAGCDGWDTKMCGGLNMVMMWNVLFSLIIFWLVFLIPFSTFYYEADDGMLMAGTAIGGTPKSRVLQALKWQMFVIVIAGAMFTICYFTFREAKIPVKEYTAPVASKVPEYTSVPIIVSENGTEILEPFTTHYFEDINENDNKNATPTSGMGTITIEVSIPTFFMAMLAFGGWFLFALFGGIGLAYVPLDLILIYVHRPMHMSPVEFTEAQTTLRDRVAELADIGEMIKIEREQEASDSAPRRRCFEGFNRQARKKQQEERETIIQFRQAVLMLEQDNEDFQNCTAHYEQYNPLLPFAALFFGVIGGLLSFFWLLQILLYVLPDEPVVPLLNTYFEWFDSWFPLFGVLSVAIFSGYLLFCAIKGCFKFGLRFLFFTLHPMAPAKTYMSSFLFNIGLILLCSVPVVQFSVQAFAQYARYSNIYQIMGTQVEYMTFFSYFFVNNIFVYALLFMMLFTTLYLMACRRRDKGGDSVELRERLKSRAE